MSNPRSLATALLLLSLSGAAASTAALAGNLDCQPRLREGWIRLPPGNTMMLAGFGRFDNRCAAAATVVSASSPSFDSVELHRSQTVDGVSRMRAVRRLELAPRGAVEMAPGGLHLMLMHPNPELQAGDRVAVDFQLADGRVLKAEFEVRALAVPAR